jgi:diguanylate cyclase (GGDEF)-like protein
LLPRTELEAARHVAERLRQRISSQPIYTDKGPIAVTVSLGISILTNQVMDLAGLLNRADQAMYVAKSSGRNCVVVAEEV